MANSDKWLVKQPDEARTRTWPLNVFLIHNDLKSDDQILGDLSKLSRVRLQLPDGAHGNLVEARLYYLARKSDKPKWASFFGTLLSEVRLPEIISAPALLIVPVDSRLMAIAFSYGSALMEPGTFDPTFGLRTALNSIKPGKVRSYDKRTFDALFKQTREQAAQATKLESFGIDAERDLVRTVSGKPDNKVLGTSMAGSGSLHTSVEMSPKRLVHYLRRLYNQSTLSNYTEEYPWLGRIQEVLDRDIRATLDSYLDDRLQETTEGIWLAAPEIIDAAELSGFRFIVERKNSMIYPELSLDSLFRSSAEAVSMLTIDFLRGHRVEMVNGNDVVLKKWKLYECLNVELLLDNETYILSSGIWYRVDSDLISAIDHDISALESATIPLPAYDVDHKNELDYNQKFAGKLPNLYCCLDGEQVMFGGGRNRFEICDLLDSSGNLVHVKRYGGSSVLSHLFAQGLLSADLLMKRPGFRESADKLVKEREFPLDEQFGFKSKVAREVIYVIIGGPANEVKHQLPLFSRVNLRSAIRSIRAFGWNVKLQFVPETELRSRFSRAKRKNDRN